MGGGGRLISCVVFRRGAAWCGGGRGRAGHETAHRVDVGGLLQAEMGWAERRGRAMAREVQRVSSGQARRDWTGGIVLAGARAAGLLVETDCWVVGGHQHRQEAGISVIHQGKSGAGRI